MQDHDEIDPEAAIHRESPHAFAHLYLFDVCLEHRNEPRHAGE
jgi:hypothetical protein